MATDNNTYIDQLQAAFYQDLARLNEQQRAVVEATEGPMFVVSGPGTGKTTMVTLRIANLLTMQDVKAENILCFSFTNAACTELRHRLEKRIGGIAAHKVGVYTFHAFANEVLMQHIDYLGIRNLRTVSDLEKIEITKSLIDNLPVENPLRRLKGDEYFEVSRLIWLRQVMREEGWNAESVAQKIDAFVENLPGLPDYQYKRKYTDKKTGVTYRAGDPNPAKIEEVKRYMQFTKSAVLAMPVLGQKIAGQGYYDYADMIAWATNMLAANEGLRRFLQEKYQYIIVDEFQDTSGSQLRLLELLLEYWMPDANVLMVGDPDQQIMGFQGAHAHSQQQFLQNFMPHLQTVSMDYNYRSTTPILLAAHSVICQNTNRLREQPLTSGLAPAPDAAMPVVRQYATPTHELAHIAHELQVMHRQGKDLSNVFCLFPKHRLYEEFILALDGLGVPYRVQRPIDVLSHRTAQMALTIFEYIAIECDRHRQGEGEHLLFEALHFPFIGVSHADASRITRYIWQHEKPLPSWFTVLNTPAHIAAAGCEDAPKVASAGFFFGEVLAQAFAKASVMEIYRSIMHTGGLLKWVMAQPDALLHLDVLNALHRFLDEQTQRKPYLTCYDLIQIIADMRSEGIRLNLQRTAGSENGVQIMTLHAAKGMEADTVYMVGCRKDLLDDTGMRGATQYKLPPSLTRTAFDDGGEEERRKLFYVGMTRARKTLYISYSSADTGGKERSKSRFVSELLAHCYADEQPVQVPEFQLAMYQAAAIGTVHTSADLGDRLTDDELNDLLRNYKLSPTHLNIYLNCPREFYLNYVLRVPRVKNMYAAFGSAVDEALRELHRIGVVKGLVSKAAKETEQDKKDLLEEMLQSRYGDSYSYIAALSSDEELATLLQTFEEAMRRQRGYFPSQTNWENRLAYGNAQLTAFYHAYRPYLPQVCQTGYGFTAVFMDGIPLTGEIDNLVWVSKDEVRVEDWKTGNATKGIAKVTKVADISAGITPEITTDSAAMGEYRRQIYFYKLLLQYHPTLLLKPVSGKVRFIESHDTAGEPVSVDVQFDHEEELLVKKQIAHAYHGIMSKQFNTGCNDPLCAACRFVKETGIVLPGGH